MSGIIDPIGSAFGDTLGAIVNPIGQGIGGIFDGLFGGDSPDTGGMSEQARRAADLADRSFAWFTQEYDRTRGQRDSSAALADRVAQSQLDSLNQNSALSRDLADYQRTTFRPVEQRLAAEAMNFDTPERREQAAGQAAADVNAAAGANRQATMRAMMRRGGSLSGARMASMASQNDITLAKASAGAQNTARRNIETQGWARMSDVANLGRNIASSQATSANVATQAGAGAVQAAQAGTAINASGVPIMSAGFNTALQGHQTAGNLYGGILEAQTAQNASDMQGLAGIGQIAGMAAMYF